MNKMPKFNVDEYRAELAELSKHCREMDDAVHNMYRECDSDGISDQATSHLREFLDALAVVDNQKAEVSRAMILGLKL
jgi:hypothetical protein